MGFAELTLPRTAAALEVQLADGTIIRGSNVEEVAASRAVPNTLGIGWDGCRQVLAVELAVCESASSWKTDSSDP